ncbi:MAG: cupredoxin family copper-binding protein [Actinomycetia bacterium]|nr:cupredoxin family copper-binding protein [Actinomycetes bacterium]
MTKRILLLSSLVAGMLLIAACSSSSTGTSAAEASDVGANESISIEDFAFGPDGITISVGDTITWTNDESGVGHTTTSDDGVWDSKLLNPGDTFERTLNETGTFSYFCSIHPSMTASITVAG